MPIGTGADKLRNLPSIPYTPDLEQFNRLTQRNVVAPISVPTPGPGQSRVVELPQAGILTWLTVTFSGTLTWVDGAGTIETRWPWPYGLLDTFDLSANFQNGLIQTSGVDLHVHRFLTNPSFVEGVDTFEGTIGGGDTLTDGSEPLHLTWQIPVVMDRVSLIGALYAQSSQNNLTVRITEAPTDQLFDLTADAAVTISGTWTITIDSFDIPQHPELGVITPDLSRLHGLQSFEVPFANSGDVVAPLIRVHGQMSRLLLQVRSDADTIVEPLPGSDWTALRLEYGANKRPYDYSVLATLTARNNEHYGAPLPYGYVCLDFVRENARRDSVLMHGVTNLRAIVELASGLTPGANAAVRLVEETLFA